MAFAIWHLPDSSFWVPSRRGGLPDVSDMGGVQHLGYLLGVLSTKGDPIILGSIYIYIYMRSSYFTGIP